jgi:hypothetical protein
MFNIKTEEDLMILNDYKTMNKKLKVEGIIMPNKLIKAQDNTLEIMSPRFLKIDDFSMPDSIY